MRYITLKAEQHGDSRIETYLGREWVVVPVVALVEGVIHAMNAKSPEFVPASAYSKAPISWNGRPVFVGHPMRNGEAVSGNTPEILEAECFGAVFNATLKKGKLVMEAWLDTSRADVVPEGRDLLERIAEKEPIEISVGAFVETNDTEGEYNGKAYVGEWLTMMPDHLALLREDELGACSIDMGCGVRAAKGGSMAKTKDATHGGLFARIMEAFRPAQDADEMSDNDLRRKLYDALKPFDGWVEAIYMEQSEFVYCAYGPDMKYYRRGYTLAKDGKVSLNGEAVLVEPTLVYEPLVAAKTAPAPLAAACSCQHAVVPPVAVAATLKTEAEMKREDVLKLIETATDEQLEAVGKAFAPAAEVIVPATPVVVDVPAVAAKAKTFAELVAEASPDVRDAINEGARIGREKKNATIATLKASGRCDLTDDQLKVMTQADLDKLVKLANVTVEAVDFSAAGVVKTEQPKDVAPPASLIDALKAAKK